MKVESLQPESLVRNVLLEQDPRWLLVQRILASEGFQRAGQLRKILGHISKIAILHPEQELHEYEIACDILQRPRNFDPATDNIVRAQFTNLRRKLDRYFVSEGRGEHLVLRIPKGSYQPVFTAIEVPAPLVVASALSDKAAQNSSKEPAGATFGLGANIPAPMWRRWKVMAEILLMTASVVAITLSLQNRYFSRSTPASKGPINSFLQFLAQHDGDVAVVLPDTSEMMIQLYSGTDISAADYGRGDFADKQLAAIKDPGVRDVLSKLAKRRNTTVTEANVAFDLVKSLNQAGVQGEIRYARDLHVRDLNEGNAIFIGSKNSDPWVSRFTDLTNFRFTQENDNYYFENLDPKPGEQPRYHIVYASQRRDAESYVDVAFMQNASKTGYILLIIGSDSESNEAAARFLLHGKLPPEITSLLTRKDLHSFELFLGGKHIAGEAEDSLELVALRPK